MTCSRARRRTRRPGQARCSTRSPRCARPPPAARRARRGSRPTTSSSARRSRRDAINFTGEPRIQGGPGSSVRLADAPEALPLRTTRARRRQGRADRRARHGHVRPPVAHERPARARQRRRLGRRARRLRRRRVRPRHVHRRPDPAGRARREVYVVKVLDSHGVGDDLTRRHGDGAAAAGHRHRQPLARRLHRPRRAAAGDRQRAERDGHEPHRRRRRGRQRRLRPPVLARRVQAGARRRRRRRKGGKWAGPTSATTAGGSTRPPAASTCSRRSRAARPRSPRARRSARTDPIDRLRRLGGVGRHLVRLADHRRDDRPHDVAQRPAPRPPRRRPTCSRTAPPAPRPTSRSPCWSTSSKAARTPTRPPRRSADGQLLSARLAWLSNMTVAQVGFDVFLSHNSRDKPAVRADRGAAEARRGSSRGWTVALTPGGRLAARSWARASTRRRACAVFVGPADLGDWENQEVALALDRAAKERGFRVFLVLLPGRAGAVRPEPAAAVPAHAHLGRLPPRARRRARAPGR